MRLTKLLPMDILYAGRSRPNEGGLDFLDEVLQNYLKKNPMMRKGLFDGKHTEHVLRMAFHKDCIFTVFEDEVTKVRVAVAADKADVPDVNRLEAIIQKNLDFVHEYTR